MNYIDKWFHFYETTDSFLIHKKQGVINPDSICFIKETGQLYAQGSLFGICRDRYEKLEQLALTHSAKINDILGIEGSSVGDGVINNIADLVNFLDGFTDQDNLKEALSAMKDALEEQVSEVNRALIDRVTKLDADVNLINSKLVTIDTRLDNHDVELQALRSSIDDHIKEYVVLETSCQEFFYYVNHKFDTIDDTITAINTSLGTLQTEFTNLNREFSTLKNTLHTLSTTLDTLKIEHREMSDKLDSTLADFEQFKRDVDSEIDDFKATVGAPNGVAPLDSDTKIPSAYLPSYVDDVLEYATKRAFPSTGESGKIYVALDDNLTYRWSGSSYIEISKSLGLGETTTTAYAGNKGKKNADDIAAHKADTNNPHNVTKTQLGLDKVNNTSDENKPISKATQAALDTLSTSLGGHINDETNPHNVTKEQLGLGNVDNTADIDKPISTATQNVLDTKVDKIEGKGLSTNDFTNEDKARLDRATTLDGEGKFDANQIPIDEEDLTVNDGVIKFKDRTNHGNKGYKILRPSNTNMYGIASLTQEMFDQDDTIYEIRYDFSVTEKITIPDGSILKFNGGAITGNQPAGGTIIDFNHCKLEGEVRLIDIICEGSIDNYIRYAKWFINMANTNQLSMLKCLCSNAGIVYLGNKTFSVIATYESGGIKLSSNLSIIGENETVINVSGNGPLFIAYGTENINIKNLIIRGDTNGISFELDGAKNFNLENCECSNDGYSIHSEDNSKTTYDLTISNCILNGAYLYNINGITANNTVFKEDLINHDFTIIMYRPKNNTDEDNPIKFNDCKIDGLAMQVNLSGNPGYKVKTYFNNCILESSSFNVRDSYIVATCKDCTFTNSSSRMAFIGGESEIILDSCYCCNTAIESGVNAFNTSFVSDYSVVKATGAGGSGRPTFTDCTFKLSGYLAEEVDSGIEPEFINCNIQTTNSNGIVTQIGRSVGAINFTRCNISVPNRLGYFPDTDFVSTVNYVNCVIKGNEKTLFDAGAPIKTVNYNFVNCVLNDDIFNYPASSRYAGIDGDKLSLKKEGDAYFNTILKRPTWWDGTKWVDPIAETTKWKVIR